MTGSAGTAQAKKEALEAAGVNVGRAPTETADRPGFVALLHGTADLYTIQTPVAAQPTAVLAANTTYRFTVTDAVRDLNGAALVTCVFTRNSRRTPLWCAQSPISLTSWIRVIGCSASVPGQRRLWPSEQP